MIIHLRKGVKIMDFPKTEEGFSHYLAKEKSQWKNYSQSEKREAWNRICSFHKEIYNRILSPHEVSKYLQQTENLK